MDEFMIRTNAEDGCLQMLFAFLFRIAFTMLLAPIAAIFFIIKNLTTISNSKSALAKAQEEYNTLTSSRYTTNVNQSKSAQNSSSSNNSGRQQAFASSVSTSTSKSNARLIFNGKTIPLAYGRNVIGRRAETSPANVQIPADDLYMSRQHCVINVSYGADGRPKVTLSNYQNKNRTAVNGRVINGQDNILLSDGNQITLGRTTMTFKTI